MPQKQRSPPVEFGGDLNDGVDGAGQGESGRDVGISFVCIAEH